MYVIQKGVKKMVAKKTSKNIKFEEALAELEAAVEKLESGDLPLEEVIAVFQNL